VDCGTLSSNLLESELFGYSKGAFTGAHDNKEGIFSLANGGTIFLDEISNISLAVQGKLLRFLETREFLPLGATTPCQVNIRLIFATNKNLQDMVAEGSFREDFYYRIDVYPILLPQRTPPSNPSAWEPWTILPNHLRPMNSEPRLSRHCPAIWLRRRQPLRRKKRLM
jgi:transcriptional regulator with PAS, ATPase and Fis domain